MHYVYNPPNDQFALPALGHRDLPHIVIGDFNSHSTSWGYDTTDNNGESVEQWADSCYLTLNHDAKLPISFNSARWKKGYNPYLIFASGSMANICKMSNLLFIVRSRLLVYSAGSGVNRVQVVLSGFNKRLFCFVQAKTFCRYGCMYFLAALVLVCVDVIVMSSA